VAALASISANIDPIQYAAFFLSGLANVFRRDSKAEGYPWIAIIPNLVNRNCLCAEAGKIVS
jgi:hypothetical protein